MSPFTSMIIGGDSAATEASLRLRRLAADHVTVTLVSPNDDLIDRPQTVLVPFTSGEADRYPIQRIAMDTGARWVGGTAAWVDLGNRPVHTTGSRQLPYHARTAAGPRCTRTQPVAARLDLHRSDLGQDLRAHHR
jgi:hypothetical protein